MYKIFHINFTKNEHMTSQKAFKCTEQIFVQKEANRKL